MSAFKLDDFHGQRAGRRAMIIKGADDDRERVRAAVNAGALLAVVCGDAPGAAAYAVPRLSAAEVAFLLSRFLLLRSGTVLIESGASCEILWIP